MLSLKVVEEVERLLLEGKLSHRQIAARLRVSRGSVSAIASGRRGIFGKSDATSPQDAAIGQQPAERCPRCGFQVYMPCLVCRAREYRAAAGQGRASLPRAG
jgi:hypothetical protein